MGIIGFKATMIICTRMMTFRPITMKKTLPSNEARVPQPLMQIAIFFWTFGRFKLFDLIHAHQRCSVKPLGKLLPPTFFISGAYVVQEFWLCERLIQTPPWTFCTFFMHFGEFLLAGNHQANLSNLFEVTYFVQLDGFLTCWPEVEWWPFYQLQWWILWYLWW